MKLRWYAMLDRDARIAFWTSFAGFSLDAMDVQLYAFVLPVLLPLWGLSHAKAGLLSSVTLVSSALGGWVAGLLSDRLGRVRVLKVTILWLAGTTCLCGLAADFDHLLWARSLQGIGFGAELAAGSVFVAEVAAPTIRARMVGSVQSGWAVGWGLAAANSALLLALLPAQLGWRVTFLVGLVPALLVFVFRMRLKETESFLKRSGRAPWHAIFSGEALRSTFQGGLLASGMHGGYWAIATWWPAILRTERGFSSAKSSAYFGVLVLGSLFGYAVGAWLGDRAGRRATLASFALGAALLTLLCTKFAVSDTALLLLSFPLGFFALGMFSAINAVLSELYPTALRGAGMGFCYNLGRGLAGLLPVLIGVGVGRGGVAANVGLYASCAYAVVLIAAAWLPETRGRALV